jgi:hypothetical protein
MEVKRKYDQVKITPSNHPYFAHGSWYFRHVLDEHSPLLQPRVKKIIVKSGGWPSDLNDHAKIRRCLSKDVFEIVSFLILASELKLSSYPWIAQLLLLSHVFRM